MDTYVGYVGRGAWLDILHQEIRANGYIEVLKLEYLSMISDCGDYYGEKCPFLGGKCEKISFFSAKKFASFVHPLISFRLKVKYQAASVMMAAWQGSRFYLCTGPFSRF